MNFIQRPQPEAPKRSLRKVSFRASNQASELSAFFNGGDLAPGQDRWSSGVWGHEVAQGLPQSRGQ
jgi:hypothetical protein